MMLGKDGFLSHLQSCCTRLCKIANCGKQPTKTIFKFAKFASYAADTTGGKQPSDTMVKFAGFTSYAADTTGKWRFRSVIPIWCSIVTIEIAFRNDKLQWEAA